MLKEVITLPHFYWTKKSSNASREILNTSKRKGIILDPFMGSGTTGVASAKLNRNFIGIELNEEYFNLSLKRIKEVL